jgi:hypothetical protein
MVAPMTQATSRRRGQGEDSIYWDASKNRYIGAVSLGFSPTGTRIRKKVTGRTKTEVRDKLRELHKQVEGGLRPRRRYTVDDARGLAGRRPGWPLCADCDVVPLTWQRLSSQARVAPIGICRVVSPAYSRNRV